MTIALPANITPAGTYVGSPIEVVDLFTLPGQTAPTTAVRIPDDAQPNDVILAFFGAGAAGTTPGPDNISAFVLSPTGLLTTNWHELDTAPTTAAVEEYVFSHVVKKGDQGRSVAMHWTAPHFDSWGLAVWHLRHVNTSSIFGGSIAPNHSVGNANHSPTNAASTTVDGALLVGAFCAVGGSATEGIAGGPVSGWYNTDVVKGSQINFGMMTGAVDMPLASQWQGADTQWFQPSGTLIAVGFASIVCPIAPQPVPGAPTLTLTPSGSSIDAAGQSGTPLKATIAYTPVSGQGQLDAWYLGRQPHSGGAVQWWNAAANLWQSAVVANLDTPVVDPVSGLNTFTEALPASAFADDGTNWDVAAFVRESGLGYASASSTVQTFTADPPPVVTAVSITNPNSATPTIGWTESITRSASAQVQYRTKLFTLAATQLSTFDPNTSAAIYDSGAQTSTALSAATSALAGGQDLVPYVVISQTGGQVSAWKAGPVFFNNQGAALAVPTVVAAPSTDLVTGAPRVALTLSGTAPTALVEYSDDQVTWYTVRDQHTGALATAVALAGSPTIYDGEAPPGADRFYRATGSSASGAYPRSASSTPVSAIAPLGQFWLRRPLTGDSMLLKVTGDKIVEKMHEDATRYSIGGRKNAVWIRESPVHGVTLKLSVYFTDQGSSDKFDAMRDAQETLLLQSDTSGKQWYVALPPEPERPLRLTGSRLAGKPIRDLELELDEQDRPT